ncbi:hypothetical protein HMN09_00868700 [Mycena chlorophos]|uniref:Uncharacterized protein n=1 Tax=Mycena chlorophos TaxID=658473 RepID=A0A8H6SPH5_MYCCL|nr:hypothetical protein HMN09_00868700 [Mycena chlorophos]
MYDIMRMWSTGKVDPEINVTFASCSRPPWPDPLCLLLVQHDDDAPHAAPCTRRNDCASPACNCLETRARRGQPRVHPSRDRREKSRQNLVGMAVEWDRIQADEGYSMLDGRLPTNRHRLGYHENTCPQELFGMLLAVADAAQTVFSEEAGSLACGEVRFRLAIPVHKTLKNNLSC